MGITVSGCEKYELVILGPASDYIVSYRLASSYSVFIPVEVFKEISIYL